eukprot:9478353-Pyramimonas_sp.AAC.1
MRAVENRMVRKDTRQAIWDSMTHLGIWGNTTSKKHHEYAMPLGCAVPALQQHRIALHGIWEALNSMHLEGLNEQSQTLWYTRPQSHACVERP